MNEKIVSRVELDAIQEKCEFVPNVNPIFGCKCFYCGENNLALQLITCSNCNGDLSKGFKFMGTLNNTKIYLEDNEEK